MEKKKPLVTDELIIVGGRHGELSDKLIPLFCEGNPIEEKDIRKEIGCEIVYLMRSNNDHDPYAIGVFTASMKRLGYLWVHQSYAMYEWMLAHKVGRVRARICRVNTKYGFMISKPLTPMKLTIRPSENLFLNMDWGNDLPKLQHCRMIEKLNLSMMMLEDALAEDDAWNEDLRLRIEDVIERLPYDLSTLTFVKGVRLYLMMKDSKISEVRGESDRLLYTMIHRGSPEKMDWWLNSCLTSYFNDAGRGSLLRMYECANYTLEQVEALLHQAPAQLFHYYLAEKEYFPAHLLYSSLPYELYVRFLTLLAVRETMIKGAGKVLAKKGCQSEKTGCFKIENEYVKLKVEAVVKCFYNGSAANLALIEIVLFEHNMLKKRNDHTPLLRALVAWGIMDRLSVEEMKNIAGGMAYKMHSLPASRYVEWDERAFANEKKTCEDIGKILTQ